MPLSTNGPIGTAEIDEICDLRDDVYRNRWITYAYWKISERLRGLIGDNASWCTFSTWSSRTIGESLRLDKATRRIEELVYDEDTSITAQDHPWLLRLQYRVITRDHGAAQLALAIGNRTIFREIGYSVTQLLEWVERNPTYDRDAWRTYRESNVTAYAENLLFPKAESGERQLWRGLDCYYDATNVRDRDEKAQLVLQGNILLGAYEQERADRLLKVALEPFPGRYVSVVPAGPNATDTRSLEVETSWALRRAWSPFRITSELFATFMTQRVMALNAPLFSWAIRPLKLGRPLRPPEGTPRYPSSLETLTQPEPATLFGTYDRSRGTVEGGAAQNWTCFRDRMNFITNLFRAGQQDENLYRPLPAADLKTLQLDLSDDHLNWLRTVGDDEIDPWITGDMDKKTKSVEGLRKYVRELVDTGFGTVLAAGPPKPELPRWADRAKLWAGQEFFRRFGLEIGAVLFSASLPTSYTAAHGAQVLTTTTELVSDARRRLGETGQMLLDAMASDDSSKPPLHRESRAYQAARNVRLFHGAVRRMITSTGTWDEKSLGVPINQEDLVGTLAAFTVAVIGSLDEMGVTVTVQDRDAYFHLWLVMGHLLGINYDRLFRQTPPSTEQPITYSDMQLISRVILARNRQASPGGQGLMAALLRASETSMPRFFRGVPRALTRRLIGDEDADMLGVPPAGPMRLVTAALRPVNAIVSPYVRSNALARLNVAVSRQLYRWWIAESNADPPPWRRRTPWRFPAQWVEPAGTRARRRAAVAVHSLPVIPVPAKARIAEFVRP